MLSHFYFTLKIFLECVKLVRKLLKSLPVVYFLLTLVFVPFGPIPSFFKFLMLAEDTEVYYRCNDMHSLLFESCATTFLRILSLVKTRMRLRHKNS